MSVPRRTGLVFLLLLWPVLPEARARDVEVDCRVGVFPPTLDFEFRYYSGYVLSTPVEQIAGPARPILLRLLVRPLDPEGAEPARLERRLRSEPIPEFAKGRAELQGSFAVGEGRYQVFLEFRDGLGHRCGSSWEIEAKRNRSERNIKLSLEPGEVRESAAMIFRPQSASVDPSAGPPLRIKVLLNLDVWRRRRRAPVSVRLYEFVPRLAAMRALLRHPRVAEVSLAAFSIEERAVLLTHGLRDSFDFRGLERAIEKIEPAFVSIDQLRRDSDKEFFADLLLDELPGEAEVDAYVFLGPDGRPGRKTPREVADEIGPLGAPIIYLKTGGNPFHGLVGTAVKRLDGKDYGFRSPKDLAKAIDKAIERIDESRAAR